jgi:hypothetical protein
VKFGFRFCEWLDEELPTRDYGLHLLRAQKDVRPSSLLQCRLKWQYLFRFLVASVSNVTAFKHESTKSG